MMTEVEKLGMTIEDRIRRVNKSNKEVTTEIGKIVSGLKLKMPALGNIPNGDYTVCKHVGELKAGNEVLVIWVDNEPIVVGRL